MLGVATSVGEGSGVTDAHSLATSFITAAKGSTAFSTFAPSVFVTALTLFLIYATASSSSKRW